MRFRRWVLAGSLPAAATLPVAAAEGNGTSLIQPELGTIFWTTITFLLLAFLLGRYAWKPLLGALEQRERSIRANIDQAGKDRDEAESLLQQQRDLLMQARRERGEAVAAGQRDAERLKAEILDEARSQREQLLKQTETQIQAGMRQARSELRSVAADLAIQAAEKLLAKNLDDAAHRRLIEDYLADLERGSGSSPS